jgi:hypothetical protein
MARQFDVFLSYRREGGDTAARFIKEKLESRHLRVFLDVSDLTRGYFDETLLTQIAVIPNFVIILSPHALDRCINEDDWLRKEISVAIAAERNIVPVLMPGFVFPDLPPEINSLRRYEGVDYSHTYADGAVSRIYDLLLHPRSLRPTIALMIAGFCLILITGLWLWSAPRIERFDADPAVITSGAHVKLNWSAAAQILTILPTVGRLASKSGQIDLVPSVDTEYVLTAKTFFREERKTAKVKVTSAAAISADPSKPSLMRPPLSHGPVEKAVAQPPGTLPELSNTVPKRNKAEQQRPMNPDVSPPGAECDIRSVEFVPASFGTGRLTVQFTRALARSTFERPSLLQTTTEIAGGTKYIECADVRITTSTSGAISTRCRTTIAPSLAGDNLNVCFKDLNFNMPGGGTTSAAMVCASTSTDWGPYGRLPDGDAATLLVKVDLGCDDPAELCVASLAPGSQPNKRCSKVYVRPGLVYRQTVYDAKPGVSVSLRSLGSGRVLVAKEVTLQPGLNQVILSAAKH